MHRRGFVVQEANVDDQPTPEEIHEALTHLADSLRTTPEHYHPRIWELIDEHLDLLLDAQCAA